jgi:hypothetical protein
MTSELQEKSSSLKRKHLALQNCLHFCGSFRPSWTRTRISHADPDPADQNECGSGPATLDGGFSCSCMSFIRNTGRKIERMSGRPVVDGIHEMSRAEGAGRNDLNGPPLPHPRRLCGRRTAGGSAQLRPRRTTGTTQK